MEEGLKIIKGLFAGGSFSFTGKHYRIKNLEGTPHPVQKPHPPILLGGGGRRMLSIAAREADIVNINYNLATGSASGAVAKTGTAQATDEKVRWIRDAAGDRFDQIELGAYIYSAGVTEDRDAVAAAFGPTLGMEPSELLAMPHVLFGTVDQIIEDLQSRRERFGFSYVILPGDVAEDLAPVVERLAGT
jgi:probable F420-dependent oxidoreductase